MVVTLMQADARLVEDIEHAHQARADLGRQADSLCFTAGKRGRRAIEREVIQSDIDQEAKALADFLEDLSRDQVLAFGQGRASGTRPDQPTAARRTPGFRDRTWS